MLRFVAPQWFLLLPVIAVVAWRWPRAELWRPLRAVCLVLLTVFLAGPEWRRTSAGLDLWVLVDRSASAAENLGPRRAEMEEILSTNKGAEDRLYFVDFASAPVRREAAVKFEPAVTATRLRLAAEFALAERAAGRAARLLVLSDGYSTEDLGGLAGKLREARVPMDVRVVAPEGGHDFRIAHIEAPERVRPGEGFVLEAQVSGDADTAVPYEVTADGERVAEGSVLLRGGRGVIRAAARSQHPGARKYEVRLLPEGDTRPGNNAAWQWVEVSAGPGVLLVTGYSPDPLAGALRAQGFSVEEVTDGRRLHAGALSGPRVVIFNNLPAHRVAAEFLEAMDFFVNAQGGGLLMLGGKFSFGAGGYFQSPLDPLLPVSMELREEHRKLAVAMAIVLDRSGSMAAGAGPGATKMDLANEGAARAMELLGPADAVTVLAVDSAPHVVVPLAKVGNEVARMTSAVRRIQSAGGGIFVHTGLVAAWEELKKATAGQKHVVLFADAADAEEPGEYKSLLAEMTAAGATVSVIGLGSPDDPDAAFLEDIAARGGGRIFFNADPTQLPGLFAQETVAVARSAFLTEPVSVVDAGGWTELAAAPIAWPAKVDGYNLSYLRPAAAAAALSGDEYAAPLVAFWQRGAGRAAAVSFPTAGDFSESFRQWPRAADFERTLVRWLLPATPPPGASLRVKVVGEEALVELMHDATWTKTLAEHAPRLVVAEGAGGRPTEITWEKITPDRFRARVAIPPGGWVRGVVETGRDRWAFGPIAAGMDPEWNFDPARLQALRDAARASGGREITDLREVWDAPRPAEFSAIGHWFLAALVVAFLAEIAVTRWQGR